MYLVGVVTNLGNLEEILKKMEITNLLENNYTKIQTYKIKMYKKII